MPMSVDAADLSKIIHWFAEAGDTGDKDELRVHKDMHLKRLSAVDEQLSSIEISDAEAQMAFRWYQRATRNDELANRLARHLHPGASGSGGGGSGADQLMFSSSGVWAKPAEGGRIVIPVEPAAAPIGAGRPTWDGSPEQPKPYASAHPAAWDLVKADIDKRDKFGENKYGHRLTPHNGRDGFKDLYEEMLDMIVYARLVLYERDGK